MFPLWYCITYLVGRARQRDPDTGALSLEWIVIAGILVVAAVAAGAFFTNEISSWESKIP